jgi:hypothetical protein
MPASGRLQTIAEPAVIVSVGREVRLPGSSQEGPESMPKPPFYCEREICFTVRTGSS